MIFSVTDTEFLELIPSDIHLRRLSRQYGINETKELAMHLGMTYQTWDDLYVTFGEEPERLKFEALHKTVVGTHLTYIDIRKAVEIGKIQTIHSLCKVRYISSHSYILPFEDLFVTTSILSFLSF